MNVMHEASPPSTFLSFGPRRARRFYLLSNHGGHAMRVSISALVLAVGFGGVSQAAVITWGTATDVGTTPGNSADVSTTGSLVEAFNNLPDAHVGAPSTGDVVVNGVSFLGAQMLLDAVSSPGAPDHFSAGASGDADYDTLLSTAEFGGGPDQFTISVGGGALVNGNLYEIQVWFVEDRTTNNLDDRVMQYGDGNGNTVLLNDQFSIGTFTADGTSQALTLDAQDFGNAHITAYQIREVPEPGSLALLGLGGLMVARRRRG